MKKLKLIAIVMIAAFAFVACSKETPEAIATKFLNHLEKKQYDEAKKIGTEATGKFLDMLKSIEQMSGGQAETEEAPAIENMSCTIDGDVAKCTYTQGGENGNIELRKENGKWLVHMSKEDSMGGGDFSLDMDEEEEIEDSVVVE